MGYKTCRFFFFLIIFIGSCKPDEIISQDSIDNTQQYIFLGHTRTNSNPFMDNLVENIDYSNYDMLWLGGDIAANTSKDDETMAHVDSIFDVSKLNTLWALGNHDYANLDRISSFTGRPPFYAYNKNGITFVVLDTQDSLSNIIGLQKELFESVVDTIQESSYLILIHHKLIWMYGDDYLEPLISSVSNGRLGDCFYCINANNFYADIYPKLLAVKQRGIEVLCIAGDIGKKAKEFEYTTEEGIHFLASGIWDGSSENKALLFNHDVSNKTLNWEFKLLTDL